MDNVTSIQDLVSYSKGQIVRLPDFAEGQPFVARLKRPSLLALAKSGKIPNSLLQTANSLFAGRGVDEKKESALKDLFSVIDAICEACFVEPSYREIKKSGVELTDEQQMFIFNYSQEGTKALDRFHFQSKHNTRVDYVQEVQKNPG